MKKVNRIFNIDTINSFYCGFVGTVDNVPISSCYIEIDESSLAFYDSNNTNLYNFIQGKFNEMTMPDDVYNKLKIYYKEDL